MSRVRYRSRPSFMVVLTVVVILGMGVSVAVQAFSGADSAPVVSSGAR